VRFYTYEPLFVIFSRQRPDRHETVVLDRSRSLGGGFVAGSASDAGRESYVNVAPIPVRHGMTLGELAAISMENTNWRAPLSVVAMEGWQRAMVRCDWPPEVLLRISAV